MRIVIVGHAASPVLGSEPGLCWNWAWYLSRYHDVWLVTYPEFRSEVEAALATSPNPRLRVVWAENSPAFDPWRSGSVSTGPRFKLHYLLWLAHTQSVVRQLIKDHRIELVHHVSLNSVSAPPGFWRLGVPFVWGPVGGGQVAPAAFRSYYGRDWRRERMRRLRIGLVGRSATLRRAASNARYLLATNPETGSLLVGAGADPKHLQMMADNGLRPEVIRDGPRSPVEMDELKVLWVGQLEPRKALPILIDALGELESWRHGEKMPVRVVVAGKGSKQQEWQQHATARGVKHLVRFLGMVPHAHMRELFDSMDVLVFTSLEDSIGSVVMEAFARALPVVMLNHQGAANFPDEAAVKIAVTTPAATVRALAAVLDELRSDPSKLVRLSERALHAARIFDWAQRAKAMSGIYERICTPLAQEQSA